MGALPWFSRVLSCLPFRGRRLARDLFLDVLMCHLIVSSKKKKKKNRIGELMASDDDQRQVERVTARTAIEVQNEIPCPEAGEEVDVGEPTVVEGQRSDSQSVPTVRVGGSSSSGTRSGVGSRASEANTDDRETKRVRFTENRGQKRQGEDVEELAAKAEEQHFDADVEVGRCLKTWRVENVVGMRQTQRPNK